MPLKKKPPMPKSATRRETTQLPPASDANDGPAAPRRAAGAKTSAAAASEPAAELSQMESFENGMRLFHARQFQQAREMFLAAAGGPDRAVAHRAGLHASICERRIAAPGVVLNTPEDHYNYAITLINSRELAAAQKHLRAALEADPAADHVLYALAACQGLAGDLQGACENLKRAIDLQPRNRLAARQDPDFAAVAGHPAFVKLLYPEKKS
jgi:tetratricopeptide (TPR) repeat protein